MNEETKKQFEDALASDSLKELCGQMRAGGYSQVVIYELFSEFSQTLNDPHRQSDYDVVMGCLECIVGWCAPGACWFDHYLTNQEIYAHRAGLTEEEVQEIEALVSKVYPKEIFCDIHKEPNGELKVSTALVKAGMFEKGRRLTARKLSNGWELCEMNT